MTTSDRGSAPATFPIVVAFAASDGGRPLACGWLHDRWGLAWQVTPSMMGDLMTGGGDPEANARVFAAMRDMVKLDIPALQAAAAGR